MAANPRAQLDQLLAVLDARLLALFRRFVALFSRAVVQGGGSGPIPARRRPALLALASRELAALFGATPAASIAPDGTPATPYARLVVGGTRAAATLAVTPVVEEARRALADRPDLRDALTRPQLPPTVSVHPLMAPTASWEDPNGLRLSQRIWQSGEKIRQSIGVLLDYHIRHKVPASEVAADLERWLTPVGRELRQHTPGGDVGLYAPRRLLQHEVNRAAGSAAIEAARLSPFVRAVGWRLSPLHIPSDACDANARRETGFGPGNYAPDSVPPFPNHVSCKCQLVAVPVGAGGIARGLLERWASGQRVSGSEAWGSVPMEAGALVAWVTGFQSVGGRNG